MGFISWYIFLLGFFGGLGICILGVFASFMLASLIIGNPPIWITSITIPLTIIPGLYCIWKSINFASNLIIEEARKSIKDKFILNIAFVTSIFILYKIIQYFISFPIPSYVDSIFIGMIIIFMVFKIILMQFIKNMQ